MEPYVFEVLYTQKIKTFKAGSLIGYMSQSTKKLQIMLTKISLVRKDCNKKQQNVIHDSNYKEQTH